MSDFHPLRVNKIIRETDDTVSISFDLPSHLKKAFAYKQGQYLTFKKKLKGEELRRSYSLCSSPITETDWKVAVKKVEGGKFSSYANEDLKEGDVLETMAPMGNFYTEVKEGQKKKYVAFAAGSGITPVMSIIKTILAVEGESTITLYYGSRKSSAIIFKDELDELQLANSDRFNLNYILSKEEKEGFINGRISSEKCDEFERNNGELYKADEYFLCGPEDMIFGVQEKLKNHQVAESSIHFELFNTPVKSDDESNGEIKEIDSNVIVFIDGEEFNYTLSSKGDVILDASMDAGADVPFSCKGAVCCTCRAKLTEGKVHMDLNYALTDGEVEEGYILTCQSHPISEKVVVDYDAD